jgi:ComF family protein
MNLETRASRLLGALVSLVYPPRCAACDALSDEASAFCATCALSLEPVVRGCAACGLPLPSTVPRCLGCLERPFPFARAEAPFEFGGALARAIRRLKWGRRPDLGRPLGRLLAPRLDGNQRVVPVPLHPRRLRARRFNQAAVLALGAIGGRAAPRLLLGALERVRDTPPQSRLGLAERRANVRGAFRARPAEVRGRSVLLVDDVFTTGATAEACTRALIDAGALEVRVLTLARAMP